MHGNLFLEWELFKEVTAGCIYLSIYCQSTSEGSLGAVLLIIAEKVKEARYVGRVAKHSERFAIAVSLFVCRL